MAMRICTVETPPPPYTPPPPRPSPQPAQHSQPSHRRPALDVSGDGDKGAAGGDEDSASDLEIVGDPPKADSGKRKREADGEIGEPQPKKRVQGDGGATAGPIHLD